VATFVDQVTLHLSAGNGGDGCVSVKREKFKPLAGPDGGTKEKPVGYVCFFALTTDGASLARDPVIPGGRQDIRERSALVGMHMLRILLSGQEAPL